MKKASERKQECDGKDNKPIIRREYSPGESAALEEYNRRTKTTLKQIEFTYKEGEHGEHVVTQLADDPTLATVTLAKTTGTIHPTLSKKLLEQVTSAIVSRADGKAAGEAINVVSATLLEIEPRDGLEGLLASQMVACHTQLMKMLERAVNAEYLPQLEFYLNAANKLMRTFAAQVETLKRYRSGGEQKVTVEHVHVNAGGKAIVGNVQGGGGSTRGEESGKNESSPCKAVRVVEK